MSRFPDDYSPSIVYDNACKLVVFDTPSDSIQCLNFAKFWHRASDTATQVQRIWTQQGDPAVHGIANNCGQVSPVQSHFLWRKFQVFRVCISWWEEHAELWTNKCEIETNCNVMYFYESRHVHDSCHDVLGVSEPPHLCLVTKITFSPFWAVSWMTHSYEYRTLLSGSFIWLTHSPEHFIE